MKKLFKIALCLGLVSAAFTSCKDDDKELITKLPKPTIASAVATNRSIEIQWLKVDGAYAYAAEITQLSNDSLVYSDNVANTYLYVDSLIFGAEYEFRVKARSRYSEYDSDWTVLEFTADERYVMPLLNQLSDGDVVGYTVTLTWNSYVYKPTRFEVFKVVASLSEGETAAWIDDEGNTWVWAQTITLGYTEDEDDDDEDETEYDYNHYIISEDDGTVTLKYLPRGTYVAVTAYDDSKAEDAREYNTVYFETADAMLVLLQGSTTAVGGVANLFWDGSLYTVTRIDIHLPDGTFVKSHDVPAEDNAEGETQVTGLQVSTSYTATAYNDDEPVGFQDYNTVTFTTTNEVFMDGSKVVPVGAAAEFIATAKDGEMLYLMAGENYEIESTTINSSILLYTNLENPATLTITGTGFDIASVDTVSFRDLVIRVESASPFLNLTAFDEIGTITIDNVNFYTNTGSFLNYNPPTVSHIQGIYVTNSYFQQPFGNLYLFDMTAGTGATSGDANDPAGIMLIDFRNSTFVNIYGGITRRQDNVTGIGILQTEVTNCTFYRTAIANVSPSVSGASPFRAQDTWLFRCAGNGANLNSNITMTNNLLAKTVTTLENTTDNGSPLKYGSKGVLNVATASVENRNNYQLADWELMPGQTQFAVGQFLIDYPYVSADVFVSATEEDPDLTLTDQTLIDNQVGDPRWWPQP